MTLTWVLLEPAGLKLPEGRMARATRWQPAIFGFGQAVFAIGFAIAGLYGAGRKMYGTEQVREAGESVVRAYNVAAANSATRSPPTPSPR